MNPVRIVAAPQTSLSSWGDPAPQTFRWGAAATQTARFILGIFDPRPPDDKLNPYTAQSVLDPYGIAIISFTWWPLGGHGKLEISMSSLPKGTHSVSGPIAKVNDVLVPLQMYVETARTFMAGDSTGVFE